MTIPGQAANTPSPPLALRHVLMASQGLQDAKTRAEALKVEGNTLYVARKYKKAQAKYSEAIKLDDENAILYANCAATGLELKQ